MAISPRHVVWSTSSSLGVCLLQGLPIGGGYDSHSVALPWLLLLLVLCLFWWGRDSSVRPVVEAHTHPLLYCNTSDLRWPLVAEMSVELHVAHVPNEFLLAVV